MAQEKYTIELTHEEALMLVFLSRSAESKDLSRVQAAVDRIADALVGGDPELQSEQNALWVKDGRKLFDLSHGPGVQV